MGQVRERVGKDRRLSEVIQDMVQVFSQKGICTLEGEELAPFGGFTDLGLGRVKNEDGTSYFLLLAHPAVTGCLREILSPLGDDSEAIREYLASRDSLYFHVTIGFEGKDVHDVGKTIDTLMLPRGCPFAIKHEHLSALLGSVQYMNRQGRWEESVKLCTLALEYHHHQARQRGVAESPDTSTLVCRLMDSKSLAYLKQFSYLECFSMGEEIVEEGKRHPSHEQLFTFTGNLRMAEGALEDRKHQLALESIWACLLMEPGKSASPELGALLSGLYKKSTDYLEDMLCRCATRDALRIDLKPLARIDLNEAACKEELANGNYFRLFTSLNAKQRARYFETLQRVTARYPLIDAGECYPESPLDCRYIHCSAKGAAPGTPSDGSAPPFTTTQMPRNFSWLWQNKLAISSLPAHDELIPALEEIGFALVVTLMREWVLPKKWFKEGGGGMQNLWLPVDNYGAPSVQVMDEVVWRVAKELFPVDNPRDARPPGKVLVHCGGERGGRARRRRVLSSPWA